MTKQCRGCEQEFPATAEFFYRNRAMPDGLTQLCKDCNKARQKAYYWNNTEYRNSYNERRRKGYVPDLSRDDWDFLWISVFEIAKKSVPNLTETYEITKKYPEHTVDDVISETTQKVVDKIACKSFRKIDDLDNYIRKAIRNDLLDWIKYNNRKKRKTSQNRDTLIEDTTDNAIPIPLKRFVGGFQNHSGTPDQLLDLKRLTEIASKHFDEELWSLFSGEYTIKEMSKRLGITEVGVYKKRERAWKAFIDDANKQGWNLTMKQKKRPAPKVEKVVPVRTNQNYCPNCETWGQKNLRIIDTLGYCKFCGKKVKDDEQVSV